MTKKIVIAMNSALFTALARLMQLRHKDLHSYIMRDCEAEKNLDDTCSMYFVIKESEKESMTYEEYAAKSATMDRFMRRLLKETPPGGMIETQVDHSDGEVRLRYKPEDLAEALSSLITKVYKNDSVALSHLMMAKMLMGRYDARAEFIPASRLN